MEPIRHRRQRLTGIETGGEVIDEALDERGDSGDFAQARHRIADPHLDRAPLGRWADVPADLVDLIDDTGGEHVARIRLVISPGIELIRQPGRRQLLEHHRPVRGVARVLPGPERRRCTHRLQMRHVGQQRIQDRQHLVPVVDPDMRVQAEDEHVPAPPLGAVDELGVAFGLGDLLVLPAREWVGAG